MPLPDDIDAYQDAELARHTERNWANAIYDKTKLPAKVIFTVWVIAAAFAWFTGDKGLWQIVVGDFSNGFSLNAFSVPMRVVLVALFAAAIFDSFRKVPPAWSRCSMHNCIKDFPSAAARFADTVTKLRQEDPLAEFKVEVLAGDDDKLLCAVLFQTVACGRRYADDGIVCATLSDSGSFVSIIDSAARRPAVA